MTIKFLGYKQDALKQHNVYRAIHDAPSHETQTRPE